MLVAAALLLKPAEAVVGPTFLWYDCPDGCCLDSPFCAPVSDDHAAIAGNLQACLENIPDDCQVHAGLEFWLGATDLIWAQSEQTVYFPGSVGLLIDVSPLFNWLPEIQMDQIGFLYNINVHCPTTRMCHNLYGLGVGCETNAPFLGALGQYPIREGSNSRLIPDDPYSEQVFRFYTTKLTRWTPSVTLWMVTRHYWAYEPDQGWIPGNHYVIEDCRNDLAGNLDVYGTVTGRVALPKGFRLPTENQILGVYHTENPDYELSPPDDWNQGGGESTDPEQSTGGDNAAAVFAEDLPPVQRAALSRAAAARAGKPNAAVASSLSHPLTGQVVANNPNRAKLNPFEEDDLRAAGKRHGVTVEMVAQYLRDPESVDFKRGTVYNETVRPGMLNLTELVRDPLTPPIIKQQIIAEELYDEPTRRKLLALVEKKAHEAAFQNMVAHKVARRRLDAHRRRRLQAGEPEIDHDRQEAQRQLLRRLSSL